MVSIQRCAPFALIFHVSSAMCSCWHAAWRLAARMRRPTQASYVIPLGSITRALLSIAPRGRPSREVEGEALSSASYFCEPAPRRIQLQLQFQFQIRVGG